MAIRKKTKTLLASSREGLSKHHLISPVGPYEMTSHVSDAPESFMLFDAFTMLSFVFRSHSAGSVVVLTSLSLLWLLLLAFSTMKRGSSLILA